MERQDQGPGRGVSAGACRGEPKRSVEWRKQNEGCAEVKAWMSW